MFWPGIQDVEEECRLTQDSKASREGRNITEVRQFLKSALKSAFKNKLTFLLVRCWTVCKVIGTSENGLSQRPGRVCRSFWKCNFKQRMNVYQAVRWIDCSRLRDNWYWYPPHWKDQVLENMYSGIQRLQMEVSRQLVSISDSTILSSRVQGDTINILVTIHLKTLCG